MAHSDKLPQLKIDNPQNALEELSLKANRLRQGFIFLTLEHTNKIVGTMVSKEHDNFILLRDSIFFRSNSILFHFNLLFNIQKLHTEQFNKVKFKASDGGLLLLDSRDQQIFLFDSIVFHSISLFDYLGNLIGYIFSRGKELDRKWNNVISSIRDTSNIMSHSPAAEVILSVNNDLVDALYKHRSELIHNKADLGAARSSVNLMSAESHFTVFAPKRFVSKFSPLRKLSKTNELTVDYASYWLIDKTFDSIDKVLAKLFEHLEKNRKVEKGKEIFIFKPPKREST